MSSQIDPLTLFLTGYNPQGIPGAQDPSASDPASQDPSQPSAPTGAPAGGSPIPWLNPGFINSIQQRELQSPQDMANDWWRRYYGMQPGQNQPTNGQKAKKLAEELLTAVIGGKGYVGPNQRMLDYVGKMYPAESQRLQGADSLARMMQMYGYQEQQLALNQNKLQALINQRNVTNAQNQQKLDQLNSARQLRNQLLGLNLNSLTDLRAKQGAQAEATAKLRQFQVEHPDIKPGQLFSMLMQPGDNGEALAPDDVRTLLGLFAGVNAAARPYTDVGSTTGYSYGVDPNTGVRSVQENRQKQFANPAILQQLGQLFGAPYKMNPEQSAQPGPQLPMAGASPMQPGAPMQPVQRPMMPPAAGQPQQPPQIFGTPVTGQDSVIQKKISMLNGDQVPRMVGQNEDDALDKQAETSETNIRNLGKFENRVNAGIENLENSIATGAASKFQGPLAGNSLMTYARSLFGTKSPNEALQMLSNIDTLYSKLGVNIRGRFTMPEIAGHMATMGQQTMTPQNALMALLALKYQAGADRLYEGRRINPSDMSTIETAIRNEMNRVQSRIANLSPQERNLAMLGKGLPKDAMPQELEGVLSQAFNRPGAASPSTGGITLDDINKEIARRAAAKK